MQDVYYKVTNISQARKMYEEGVTLYMLPNKVRIGNPWIQPTEIQKDRLVNTIYNQTFDAHGFDWWAEYYKEMNCNYECGYYVSFYQKKGN